MQKEQREDARRGKNILRRAFVAEHTRSEKKRKGNPSINMAKTNKANSCKGHWAWASCSSREEEAIDASASAGGRRLACRQSHCLATSVVTISLRCGHDLSCQSRGWRCALPSKSGFWAAREACCLVFPNSSAYETSFTKLFDLPLLAMELEHRTSFPCEAMQSLMHDCSVSCRRGMIFEMR